MIILLLLLLGFDRAQTRPDSWLDLTVYHMMEWLHLSYPSLQPPHHSCLSLSHTHTHIQKKRRRRRHPSQYIRLRLRASATFPFPLSQRIAEPTELREAENKINWKEKEEEKNRRRRSDISSAGSFDPRISFLLACIVSFRLFVLSLSTNRFHKKIIHSLVSCRVLFLSRLPPLS